MAKIDKPAPLNNFKLEMLLFQLSRGRNFRITDRSQTNLVGLVDTLPLESKPFVKTLFRINYLAIPIIKLDMIEGLTEPQNRGVLRYLRWIGYTSSLINTYDVLDTSWVTLKSRLTCDYDSQPFFEDIRRSYHDADGKPKTFESEESKKRVFYDNLMKLKYYLLFLGCLKFVARVEGSEEFDRVANKKLSDLAGLFKQLLNEFPLNDEALPQTKPEPKEPRRIRSPEKKKLVTIKDHLDDIIRTLEKGNNSAANTTLGGLTEKLHLLLQRLVRERDYEERRSGLARPDNPYEENLWRLLQRTSQVSRSEEGKLVVPQYHFVKVDGARIRKRLPHEMEDEAAAVRAEQHKLENIPREIEKNERYQRMFVKLGKRLKSGTLNFEIPLMLLRKSYNAYERGEHDPKIDVKHRVQWASEMLRLVTACRESASRDRLLTYAGGFVNLAARQLFILNSILQEQIPWISRKEKLLAELADQQAMREEELGASQPRFNDLLFGKRLMEFSDSIVHPLQYQGVLKRADYLEKMKERADKFLKELTGEIKEPWLKTAKGRIEKVSAFLATELPEIREKLAEKERLLEEARLEHIEYSQVYIFFHNFKVKDDLSKAKLENKRQSLIAKIKQVAGINNLLYPKLLFVGLHIQLTNNDYYNRAEIRRSEEDYLLDTVDIWDKIRTMSGEMHEVGVYLQGKDDSGKRKTEVWGGLTSMDIKAIGLKHRALGIFKRPVSS